jgi:peptide/nickel transport system permease protein
VRAARRRPVRADVRRLVSASGFVSLAMRQFLRDRRAVGGLIVLVLATCLAVLAPFLGLADPVQQHPAQAFAPPAQAYPLGSDSFGRDVLSRVIYGSRTSLAVGVGSIAVALGLGVPIGLLAGYRGGISDALSMRAMDGLLSFPPIVLAIVMMAALGPDVRNVVVTLGIVYTPVFARLARATTLSVREEDYVLAAQSVGVPGRRIALRHILPNVAGTLIVQASASFSIAIIAEATLSFLGLGTQPPTPSWGLDLSSGRPYIDSAPWLVIVPATAISVSVIGVNFLGDGLREALDPKLRPV